MFMFYLTFKLSTPQYHLKSTIGRIHYNFVELLDNITLHWGEVSIAIKSACNSTTNNLFFHFCSPNGFLLNQQYLAAHCAVHNMDYWSKISKMSAVFVKNQCIIFFKILTLWTCFPSMFEMCAKLKLCWSCFWTFFKRCQLRTFFEIFALHEKVYHQHHWWQIWTIGARSEVSE